jgi:hypothetical protein
MVRKEKVVFVRRNFIWFEKLEINEKCLIGRETLLKHLIKSNILVIQFQRLWRTESGNILTIRNYRRNNKVFAHRGS